MKILIIDDSSQKIGEIQKLINSIDRCNLISFDYSLDLQRGRMYLASSYYDLVILDLNIPEVLGETPSFDAGVGFVDEIIENKKLRKPTDIVILTAFDESVTAFKEKVEHAGFVVLQYNQTESNWANSLVSRIEYLLCCREQWEIAPRLPVCDVAIITAIPVETESILSFNYEWKSLILEDDPTRYNLAVINTSSPVNVIHAQSSDMGMAAAAVLATKIIIKFKPKYIFMTGIAAGISDDCNPGDILFGTDIWNYSSGKYKDNEDLDGTTYVNLLPDPKHLILDETTRELLVNRSYTDLLKDIKLKFSGATPTHDLKFHYGPIACGAAVVSSEQIIDSQIRAHSRKTIGLDMESYGICFASQSVSSVPTIPLIIKSVSDKANSAKDDNFHKYASYTSSQFAKYIIEHILF